ncbi:coiled-coil domain-containing protein 134-like [Ochlerotatus camptorhynchus]|uniref:coiled-coil domain-containing protein 134-like n=1 Tax=Ochlerotatus camptorhynchus TaxID=644619 RepID=UPI0031D39D42
MQFGTKVARCLHLVILASFITGTVCAESSSAVDQGSTDGKPSLQMTEKIYSNIFVRKREQHKLVVQRLMSTKDYSKIYDLLQLALKEILKILQEDGAKLLQNGITAETGFPKETESVETLGRYLENTCFFGELILHLPDISNRILKKYEWQTLLIQALSYTRGFVNILDQKSLELLGLLEQEIDESKRTDSYVNPYRKKSSEKKPSKQETKPTKKKKTSLKRGPQLSGAPKTEL